MARVSPGMHQPRRNHNLRITKKRNEYIPPSQAFVISTKDFLGPSRDFAAVAQEPAVYTPPSKVNHQSIPVAEEGEGKETVVVIGSGDLGRGLVSCIIRGGFRVIVASRNPGKSQARVQSLGAEIDFTKSALQESDVVVLAIPYEAHIDLEPNSLHNKILIDVSNRPPHYDKRGPSIAERLQRYVGEAKVVKALNTLSAYALQKGMQQGSKRVPVCCNDEEVKVKIMEFVRKLGFTPIDYGDLSNAKLVEDIPMQFFPDWKLAAIVSLTIFLFLWVVVFFRKQVCPNIMRPEGTPWDWEPFYDKQLITIGNSAAITSFNLLAACYFPGTLAAYIQLVRGTKYSEFPSWMDKWMKARKQLGLSALLFAALHMVLIISIRTDSVEGRWDDQGCLLTGGVSIALMVILGVTSLPSVAASLTWKEFSFVQSILGWLSLLASVIHALFSEYDHVFYPSFECGFIPHHCQIGVILPLATVALKIPTIIPCISKQVTKIRRGYERKEEKYIQGKVVPFENGVAR